MKLYDAVVFDVSGTLIYENASSKLVEGSIDLIKKIREKGTKIGLATNLSRTATNRFIEQYGLEGLVDASVCASEAKFKPETEMLHLLSLELDVDHKGMLMVGDSSGDIYMAHNFSCDSLAVSWEGEFYAEVLNASPSYSAKTMEEIYEVLFLDA